MLLKPGDRGPAVQALQRDLNKLGSMLLVDGDFGPATGDAILDARNALKLPGQAEADDTLQQTLQAIPDPFPAITAAGVTFIARAEVTSPREYRRKYKNPIWTSAESGITIGIGYDLAFAGEAQLRQDWGDHLPPDVIGRLRPVLLKKGSAELLAEVRDVEIPLVSAMHVFHHRTLPEFDRKMLAIYPEAKDLPPARRAALMSLVYNRGNRLEDRNPDLQERREMRKIRELLAAGEFDVVPEQLELMTRLWDPDRLAGLIRRRQDEARLWRSGFEALQLA